MENPRITNVKRYNNVVQPNHSIYKIYTHRTLFMHVDMYEDVNDWIYVKFQQQKKKRRGKKLPSTQDPLVIQSTSITYAGKFLSNYCNGGRFPAILFLRRIKKVNIASIFFSSPGELYSDLPIP